MTTPPDGVDRAIELADKADPTAEEAAFLGRFYADHLRPRPGEDPAAHAARLATPELFKLYRRLRTDALFELPETCAPATIVAPAEPPESVAARVLSERTPAASCHADFVDVDEDYTPADQERATPGGASSAPSPNAATRRRRPFREAPMATGTRRSVCRRLSDFVYRRKMATRLVCAAVAVAGASYGMMYLINHQARRSVEPIRQMQQQTGKAAEGIPADPSHAPIDNKPQSTSPLTAPETRRR